VIDRLCLSAGITSDEALPDDTTIICIDHRGGSGAPCSQDAALVPDRTPPLASQPQTDPRETEEQPC
jgi:hypothetical protein